MEKKKLTKSSKSSKKLKGGLSFYPNTQPQNTQAPKKSMFSSLSWKNSSSTQNTQSPKKSMFSSLSWKNSSSIQTTQQLPIQNTQKLPIQNTQQLPIQNTQSSKLKNRWSSFTSSFKKQPSTTIQSNKKIPKKKTVHFNLSLVNQTLLFQIM